jgi:hypothetical protein
MSRILRVLIVMLIISTVGISLSYAETIWEKRQKALQGQNTEQAQPAPEAKEEVSAPVEAEAITTPDETPIVEEMVEDEILEPAPAEKIALDPSDPFSITVPAMYGTIIDSYKGTNGKLIIHIQDAHANYEAQKNEAGIIESLINSIGVKLILQEGGSTDANFKYLRTWAPPEEREEKADKLLKEAVITGEEYLTITSNYPMDFQGIEDKPLYEEFKNALWEMDKFKEEALGYLNKLTAASNALKDKIYNVDLLELDKAKKDYESEATDLLAYYKALDGLIQKNNIGITEFTNFATLVKINELEKKIDFTKVNTAEATAEEKKQYDEYQEALKNLNVNKLFKEEPLVENKIQESIAETSDQKKLYRVSKAMSIMDKMIRVKLVPEEYSYFLENNADFNAEEWASFIKNKSSELGLSIETPNNYYAINDNLPKVENFYKTALEREKFFISKSEERMAEDNINTAILIAGGFHTPTLTQLLNDAGYSYIVVSPRVTTPTDDALYRAALKR